VFADQTDVPLNTLITSNAITVQGINAPAPISVSNGEYSINGGAFTSSPGFVDNGATVAVRVQSSGANSDTVEAILTIGDVSDTFGVTTLAAAGVDRVPDQFTFIDQIDVPRDTLITSNAITVTGINAPALIWVWGGRYSVNGGPFTLLPGKVNNGDSVRVRVRSSERFATTVTAKLTIGGVSDRFSVTTIARRERDR